MWWRDSIASQNFRKEICLTTPPSRVSGKPDIIATWLRHLHFRQTTGDSYPIWACAEGVVRASPRIMQAWT